MSACWWQFYGLLGRAGLPRRRSLVATQCPLAPAAARHPYTTYRATWDNGMSLLQTVGYSVVRLCDQTDEGLRLSEKKVRARIREVARAVIMGETLQQYRDCRKRITSYVRNTSIPGEHLISGKDYIFPVFISRMVNVVSHRGRLIPLSQVHQHIGVAGQI